MKYILILFSFFIFTFAQPYNNAMIEQIKSMKNPNKSFSFATYGDNRGRDDILLSITKSIDSDKEILFSINNGDLVTYGFQFMFEHYFSLIQKSKKPIVSIIGNHGIGLFENENNYKNIFGKTYFSFAFKNSYFIIVDDADDEGLGLKQLSWLQQELQKSQKYANRFVFMHIPLYDPRKGDYKKGHSLENIDQAKILNNLFDKYNVSMLFCSHIHSYYNGFWNKTPYIISGGAGAPLKVGGFFHYIKVSVEGSKIIYKVTKIVQ